MPWIDKKPPKKKLAGMSCTRYQVKVSPRNYEELKKELGDFFRKLQGLADHSHESKDPGLAAIYTLLMSDVGHLLNKKVPRKYWARVRAFARMTHKERDKAKSG